MKFRSFLLIIISLLTIGAHAQNFKWQAAIQPITESGFYKIKLTPEICAKSTSVDLVDVRIYNENKEQPYLINFKPAVYDKYEFVSYSVVEKKNQNKWSTIVFFNEKATLLDKVLLIVKNTSSEKKIAISGSNDQKDWYTISNNIQFSRALASKSISKTESFFTIDLPATDYRFYKMEFNDSLSKPLFVSEVGVLNSKIIQTNNFDLIGSPEIKAIKSDHSRQSIFKLTFKEAFLIHKLSFAIAAPHFFKRNASIAVLKEKKERRNRVTKEYVPLHNFELISGSENEVQLTDGLKEQTVYLIIENEDNPPLIFKSIKAFQKEGSLTAYLEKGKSYQLKLGSNTLAAPQYDINFFINKANDSLPTAIIDQFVAIEHNTVTNSSSIFTTKNWIWAGLIALVSLLFFISFRMIKEMNEKQSEQ